MKAPLHFTPGKLVAVNVPNTGSTQMLQKFNGYCYKVTSWKHYSGGLFMYTLEECVSEHGVPFWFADEWLREVYVDEKAAGVLYMR